MYQYGYFFGLKWWFGHQLHDGHNIGRQLFHRINHMNTSCFNLTSSLAVEKRFRHGSHCFESLGLGTNYSFGPISCSGFLIGFWWHSFKWNALHRWWWARVFFPSSVGIARNKDWQLALWPVHHSDWYNFQSCPPNKVRGQSESHIALVYPRPNSWLKTHKTTTKAWISFFTFISSNEQKIRIITHFFDVSGMKLETMHLAC